MQATDACVVINVNAEKQSNERLASLVNPKKAVLNTVRYEPCCALGARMEKGTTVAMVLAALQFVLAEFPWVEHFVFTDCCSVVECGPGEMMMPLPPLSLCWSGKTWYEKHFGAVLVKDGDNDVHGIYRAFVEENMQGREFKDALSFDAFCSRAGLLPQRVIELAGGGVNLRSMYAEAGSLQGFFEALRSKHLHDPVNPFCAIVWPWVVTLVDSVLAKLHTRDWVIGRSAIASAASDIASEEPILPEGVSGEVALSACCGMPVVWGAIHLIPPSTHFISE